MIDIERERQEHQRAVQNFREHLSTLATRLIDVGASQPAGVLLVLDRQVYKFNSDFFLLMGPAAPEPDAPAGKRRGRPPAADKAVQHRHTFGDDGKCIGCGDARRRAPNGQAKVTRPDAAARTVPLPIGDHAPDRFDSGTMGGSGVGDGRR